ncbi:MAG: sugar-transfer associated ATP-grasp domain-containing protein [Parcubacteria group bacterium]|jgi:alpha-L-glutamate ligase-like protein
MFEFIKKSRGILGMNSRNLEYIRPLNRTSAKRLADNKLLSKRILKKNDIAVPTLIAQIKSLEDLDNFDWQKLPDSFVLKPNRGFGGEGIIVIYGRKKHRDDAWVKADGSIITINDLKNHTRNILDGSYSLSGIPDTAFFEERLKLLKLFKPYAFKGIPDIRVIVFNKMPIMAMLRLPTKESHGKANLAQGAIGVGIDLASGVTTTAVAGKQKIIEYLPGTRLLLSGIKIPYWMDILTLAVRSQEISGLGFLGVDIAIDKERGPVILEINARPGLAIQVANLDGLKWRLKKAAGIKIKTVKKGIRVGMDLFGGEIEEEVEEISGKKVIGTVEKVKLIGKDGKEIEVEAKIDTGADWSSIDNELAKQLGFTETIEEFEKLKMPYENLKNLDKEKRWAIYKNVPDIASTIPVKSSNGYTYRPMINIEFVMDNVTTTTKITLVDRSHMHYPMIIGKVNLKKYLIDASK